MVGFRDWLRTHDDDRELYERDEARPRRRATGSTSRTTPTRRPTVVEEIAARAGLPPRVD